MEEVDKIIIVTLKSLNCDIEEDVSSIKKLTTEIFVEAVVKMIHIIDPTFQASKTLPNSMSAKYKYCAELSDKVKSLGFQGDIGYQTFLYGNEIEVRRTLMYLIERLPREQTKISTHTDTKLEAFKKKLSQAIVEKVTSSKTNKFISMPLETGIVKPGQAKNSMTPREWREYCIKHLKFITHQVEPKLIFPSIITLNAYEGKEIKEPFPTIEEDKEVHYNHNQTEVNISNSIPRDVSQSDLNKLSQSIQSEVEEFNKLKRPFPTIEEDKEVHYNHNQTEVNISNSIPRDISQSDLNKLSQSIQSEVEEFNKLKKEYKQLEKMKKEEEIQLNKNKKNIDINEKINIMLPDSDDYIEKLESKINGAHEKMKLLQEQWEEAKKPYLEEKNKRSKKQNNNSQYYEQLRQLRETAQVLRNEYEIKTLAFNKLNENLPKKSVNRSSYTKRILEIINNIKKQDLDISKIINDTKQVQKQLNNVNGKIERCFTLADEMIFRDVSRDEMSRKAYKYLVTLHTDCNDIVKVVTEIGNLKKEMKNLEEQIDLLCSKNIGENLLQIQKDIQHMKSESTALVNQMKAQSLE
ncbi:coiled-coil domain-containing protein 22 homolog [Diaphorina citri]|uniref:Coiled-coil domain-containing protein 22 homolog n=1 Tax=Diaphorina citri TaxID=121845 RepID=A0A1S3D623_DIACI|nr:coiled-coil domain-containing protein 22 homolog [Diaphorina citri]